MRATTAQTRPTGAQLPPEIHVVCFLTRYRSACAEYNLFPIKSSARLRITFGSSFKTSDFIVDALEAWWAALEEADQGTMARMQIKMDNGPESSGIRTQFLHRMVQFADQIGKPIHLLYYPPYHSKYNPIERCWGILELHWNGTKLVDVKTMLEWAKSMTWKG